MVGPEWRSFREEEKQKNARREPLRYYRKKNPCSRPVVRKASTTGRGKRGTHREKSPEKRLILLFEKIVTF